MRLREARLAGQPGLGLITRPLPGLSQDRAERQDLIRLVIQMPGTDGFDVLRRLQALEATRSIPVIAVISHAMPGDLEPGLAVGFVAYATKPLQVPDLLATVSRVLRASTLPPPVR